MINAGERMTFANTIRRNTFFSVLKEVETAQASE
jgi:hypothetical protein